MARTRRATKRTGEGSDYFRVSVKFDPNQAERFQEAVRSGRAQLDRDLDQELARIGEGVAARAREIAEEQGLVKTRRLVLSVQTAVVSHKAIIADTARNPNDGYPYPGRLEFGDLDRPFLQPALAEQDKPALRALTSMVERALRTIARK